MPDIQTLFAIALALGGVGYYAWQNRDLVAGWNPFAGGGDKSAQADYAAAIEHARQLSAHLHKLGLTTEANQVAEAAAKIVRASMTYTVVVGSYTTA